MKNKTSVLFLYSLTVLLKSCIQIQMRIDPYEQSISIQILTKLDVIHNITDH